MKVMTLKKLAIILFALPLLAVLLLNSVSGQTPAAGDNKEAAAALFTAKCKMCHGAKAEKLFDPSKPEDEMVEAILKGKKAEKPPNMPAYAEKGVDAEMAKALIAHMKSLKQ
jgi:mono/diheme cytochrome c family protein